MRQQLVVSIKTNKDTVYKLKYLLYPTYLTCKWIDITQQNLARDNCEIRSTFNNKTIDRVGEVFARLKELTILINKEYKKQLPVYDTFNFEQLNELHEEFELFGEKLTSTGKSIVNAALKKFTITSNLENYFFELNDQIHLCEDVLNSKKNNWPPAGLLYDLYPAELHCAIEEQDKLFLSPNFHWGKLYLGYNTLGKDWQNVQKDNDVEVIERDMVKVQERFAAEAWMNFGQDQDLIDKVNKFYNWAESLPAHIQQKVPLDNLNKLALGRYPLGKLVIDDVLLKFNPNMQDWNTPNHPCKLEWNKQVLSTFESIIKIEFEDVPGKIT